MTATNAIYEADGRKWLRVYCLACLRTRRLANDEALAHLKNQIRAMDRLIEAGES